MPRPANPWRFDVLLEDHAELRVKDLNSRGIFEASFGEIFVFRISGKEVRIRYLDSQGVVLIATMTNRKVVDQVFPVKRVLNNFGYKYYLICDMTARPVTRSSKTGRVFDPVGPVCVWCPPHSELPGLPVLWGGRGGPRTASSG